MQQNVLAMVLAVLMVGAVAGPAVAAAPATAAAGNTGLAVDVAQDDGVTVTVTDNGAGVENASVEVATVDENATYNGTGSYENGTGPNGMLSLESPTEHVEVSVTATVDGKTATTTAVLTAGENSTYANFGQSISSYIAIIDANDTDGPFGHLVASFAVENNPGNAPEHAGPPENETDGNETDSNETGGPPEHAGPPEDETDSNETDEDETRGPPEHAGPPENKTGGPPEDRGNDGDDKGNSGNDGNDKGNNGKANGRS